MADLFTNASKNEEYDASNIEVLEGLEPVRHRPGMYIGKLGDGSSPDDGIYILLKEVLDNCIDEFVMGAGKTIEIVIKFFYLIYYSHILYKFTFFLMLALDLLLNLLHPQFLLII